MSEKSCNRLYHFFCPHKYYLPFSHIEIILADVVGNSNDCLWRVFMF